MDIEKVEDLVNEIVAQREEIRDDRFPGMVQYWEGKFPGKGGAIADMLLPLFAPIDLRPALPALRERASEAVSWCEVRGTRIFSLTEASALRTALHEALTPSLWNAFGDAVERALGDDALERLTVTLAASGLPKDLRDLTLLSHARAMDPLVHALSDSMGSVIGLIAYLVYADMREELSRLHALIEIVKAGNFPVGFDAEGNLLVLVAD